MGAGFSIGLPPENITEERDAENGFMAKMKAHQVAPNNNQNDLVTVTQTIKEINKCTHQDGCNEKCECKGFTSAAALMKVLESMDRNDNQGQIEEKK